VVNIFLADDSELILRTLRKFFQGHSRFCIVGEARNYADTLLWVVKLKPDVILADLRMPGTSDYAKSIREIVGACVCPVLLMSFTADAESQTLATNAGAVSLLDKTRLYEDLITAIDQALAGR
jgi:DNA-binding NarL/FixJ family response regulator